MVGCLDMTQIIACYWEAVIVTEPSEAQKKISKELLFISRFMESNDYTTIPLTLAIEKFGSPGTIEVSVSLVLPSLWQQHFIFPSVICACLFDLALSPFRNRFSSRVDHVCVKVMQRNDVPQRSSDAPKPVSDFVGDFWEVCFEEQYISLLYGVLASHDGLLILTKAFCLKCWVFPTCCCRCLLESAAADKAISTVHRGRSAETIPGPDCGTATELRRGSKEVRT